jgi:hypothetical protein
MPGCWSWRWDLPPRWRNRSRAASRVLTSVLRRGPRGEGGVLTAQTSPCRRGHGNAGEHIAYRLLRRLSGETAWSLHAGFGASRSEARLCRGFVGDTSGAFLRGRLLTRTHGRVDCRRRSLFGRKLDGGGVMIVLLCFPAALRGRDGNAMPVAPSSGVASNGTVPGANAVSSTSMDFCDELDTGPRGAGVLMVLRPEERPAEQRKTGSNAGEPSDLHRSSRRPQGRRPCVADPRALAAARSDIKVPMDLPPPVG